MKEEPIIKELRDQAARETVEADNPFKSRTHRVEWRAAAEIERLRFKEAADKCTCEAGIREQVFRLLWEKQFEGSPWASKFHMMRPESLEADYGVLADKIIAAVKSNIEGCFILTDRRQPPNMR